MQKVIIDNRSTSDNWISNATKMHITLACNQQQAGKFSVNLLPGQRRRVSPGIEAQPYPYGKQKYDEFQYKLDVSETWEVHLVSEQLVMRKVFEWDHQAHKNESIYFFFNEWTRVYTLKSVWTRTTSARLLKVVSPTILAWYVNFLDGSMVADGGY